MGNYSIIVALGGLIVVFSLIVHARSGAQYAEEDLNDHAMKFVARQAAHTGLSLSAGRLAADTLSWKTDPTQYGYTNEAFDDAYFTVRVLANYGPTLKLNRCFIDTVDVEVTGVAADGLVEHRILATYVRTCSQDDRLHPAFSYPFITDDNMVVEQQVTIKSGTDSTNTNIHANGMLDGRGNPDVEGYGTFSTPGGQCDDCHDFLPNNDVNGDDPNVYQAPEIPLWDFDPRDYLDIATYVERGNVRLRGDNVTIDFTNYQGITGYGTPEAPFIWYVPGDLQIETNVNFNGYALIVTEGWVYMRDNANVYTQIPADVIPPESNTDYPNTAEVRPFMHEYLLGGSTLGFAIGGFNSAAGENISLKIDGRSTLMGTVFMNGGIDIPGDATIYGSITAMDDIVLDGKTMIWYNGVSAPIAELIQRILNAPDGIRLLDFEEW